VKEGERERERALVDFLKGVRSETTQRQPAEDKVEWIPVPELKGPSLAEEVFSWNFHLLWIFFWC
jgi:hypothetical protein